MATGDRVVTFNGHHSYIVSIAKLCQTNGLFTDVTILCDDGKLLAHKIVLAAVSPFLCHVLDTVDTSTGNNGQTTIVMPDVRREIVQQLLDFLYTGVMKLSPSATWELQQLVLLLQIDPQNVGVDTINVGHDPEKMERLSNTVCQTLGIKIAHKADLSNHHHKISPKHSPSPATKPSPNTIKMSPKSVKSPPLTNGVKESPKNSPPTTNHVKLSPTPTPTLKIITSPPLKNSLKTKVQDTKSSKAKPEKSLNPLKITMSASGGSIIRSSLDQGDNYKSNQIKDAPHKDAHTTISSISTVASENSNVIKIVTRKRPLSEKIDYSDMIADERETMAKKGRGGKSRAKSGGVRGGGGGKGRNNNMDEIVCSICNQFDPILPSNYAGNKTEWIGCDCNRWYHKFCTRLKEVDDSFSCRVVHKQCLPMPGHGQTPGQSHKTVS